MNRHFGMTRLAPPGWDQDGTQAPPTLVELTAKRWKGLIVVGYAFLFAGLTLIGTQVWSGVYRPMFEGQLSLTQSSTALLVNTFTGAGGIAAGIFIVSALGLVIYARFMAWWRHG
ncbi:MAG: hypothetical protein VYE18_03580 [Pseudomonadota bacterium]|nr:hypothetical protein [Pseudomonadota bacterium]